MIYFLSYLGLISLITATVTALDKLFAKKKMRRISEKALFILAFLGGALAEYTVMKLIRHKTLHKSFMIGLPFIILLQTAALVIIIKYIP